MPALFGAAEGNRILLRLLDRQLYSPEYDNGIIWWRTSHSPSPSLDAPRATSTCLVEYSSLRSYSIQGPIGFTPDGFTLPIPLYLVDRRRIKLRLSRCKRDVLSLSLSAHKLSNLKLLYQKMLLMSSLFSKTNLVLTTGFEPAMGFLLRITKPVLSAIQPSQHKIGRFRETRTLMMSSSQTRRLTN